MIRFQSVLRPLVLVLALVPAACAVFAQESKPAPESKEAPPKFGASALGGMKWRGIGPATASGRIADLAVVPGRESTWYVAVASGGVWRTRNAGTTFEPIFDDQTSYSIGCVTVDPHDPLTIWVGTGENNSQRSVGYGDGLYVSRDGGDTWAFAGLKESEHIAKVLVHPKDRNTLFVAAQGPLWKAGGDRGLFVSRDGGVTWTKAFETDEHTGVTDVVMEPGNPDVMYAATYQRARRVWTLMNGGPGSSLKKSIDGGRTWATCTSGLPGGHLGRIGLAIPPTRPEVVYALVEAQDGASGFYRSVNRGVSFEKRSSYMSTSPQYYQELVCDPVDANTVYSLDTMLQVTEDGGKTWREAGESDKHVDNHALWIDPKDGNHMVIGCDGGLYETFDKCRTWRHFGNLPVMQFYRVALDNATPFYNVYGGTQDNNTLGGPSRNTSASGVLNHEWFVTVGGDGFEPAIDPVDPNIVYSQWQHGGLIRHDRRTGESIDIQPQPRKGEDAFRWNWDSPLAISPHDPKRLWFAANRLFRSDDRGDSWAWRSPDLTRQLDRDRLEVFGQEWSIDAVAKHMSTSFYGNIVAFSESPRVRGLLYVGTDDGLIQVSEDEGNSWRRVQSEDIGLPKLAYVSCLFASPTDDDTVFATFNLHKFGDFKPYVMKSSDRGRTWTSIASDLPARGSVWTLVQDHVASGLLFVGTEFGVHVTRDGGASWHALKSGMPTIAVRDLEIHRRDGDLVAASFGRGFFVLDDYTPLREISAETLAATGWIGPVRPAQQYVNSRPLGGNGKAFQGSSLWSAPNPEAGAVFTVWVKDGFESAKDARRKAERDLEKKKESVPTPSIDVLRKEAAEEGPSVALVIRDADGTPIRKVDVPGGKGMKRVRWNLRTTAPDGGERGALAAPGTYSATLVRTKDGVETELAPARSFEVRLLREPSITAGGPAKTRDVMKRTGDLQRAVSASNKVFAATRERVTAIKSVLDRGAVSTELRARIRAVEATLAELDLAMNGDKLREARQMAAVPGIAERIGRAVGGMASTTYGPTGTWIEDLAIAEQDFKPWLATLRRVIDTELPAFDAWLDAQGAPWTPGRLPKFE